MSNVTIKVSQLKFADLLKIDDKLNHCDYKWFKRRASCSNLHRMGDVKFKSITEIVTDEAPNWSS